MRRTTSRTAIGAAATAALVLTSLASGASAAKVPDRVQLRADLAAMNDSGVTGLVRATVSKRTIRMVHVKARGLAPAGAAHAVHIHFGQQARHECPTLADDDGDFRLNVVDGIPAYGPVSVAFTSSGDTSPASALALDRMPVAEGGMLTYHREGIRIGDVPKAANDGGTLSSWKVARGIRAGQGVIVMHGNDYNGNGGYDLDGAGESELMAGVPAEASDPTACGVLRTVK